MPLSTYRLSQLPPYVLARVDELKSRLRAEGREIFDFGLGNPDGPSPAAVVARLQRELGTPGFQRYMPSKGIPELREGICRWYQRRYGVTFNPETEAVATIGSKEGIAHLLLALLGPGDCVLAPDPGYPIHQKGVVIGGGEVVPVAVGPDKDHFAEIEAAMARSPRPPKGLIVNFPHNPTTATADLGFYAKVVALAKREKLWVISDLAYADLCFDDQPAPSIFQAPGRPRCGGRVLHGLEELLDAGLAGGLLRGQSRSGRGPGHHQGLSRLRQLRPQPAGRHHGAGRLRRRRGQQPGGVQAPGEGPVRCAQRGGVAGDRAHGHDVRVGRHSRAFPRPRRPRLRVRIAAEGRRGSGSRNRLRPGGEGFVRFSLIESDERVRRACEQLAKLLKS